MFSNKIKQAIGNEKIILPAIVLFGIILRLVFFSGIGLSDDLTYAKSAYNFWRNIDPDSVLTLSTRSGLAFFTNLSYNMFGINDFSSIFFVLFLSICNVLLAYHFGKMIFDEKTGIIASFLMAIFPMEVLYSTKLGSDLPSAFFTSLGVFSFIYAEKIRKSLCYLASGLLIGIAYTIRESALLIALFFLGYSIFKKSIKREYFLMFIGFLFILLLELLYFYHIAGNPFYRFEASQSYLSEKTADHNYFGRLEFPKGLFHYPYLILTSPILLFFYAGFFASLIYILGRKKRDAYTLVLWFLPLLVYLSFGSGSLLNYTPFRAVDRYLSIITMPGMLLLAYFIANGAGRIFNKLDIYILAFLLLSSVAVYALHDNADLKKDLAELHPLIKESSKTVYIDRKSFKAVEYISRFNLNPMVREYPYSLSGVKDSYIVINFQTIRFLKESDPNYHFPAEISAIPKTWKLLNEIGNAEKIYVYYAQ